MLKKIFFFVVIFLLGGWSAMTFCPKYKTVSIPSAVTYMHKDSIRIVNQTIDTSDAMQLYTKTVRLLDQYWKPVAGPINLEDVNAIFHVSDGVILVELYGPTFLFGHESTDELFANELFTRAGATLNINLDVFFSNPEKSLKIIEKKIAVASTLEEVPFEEIQSEDPLSLPGSQT